MRVDKILKDFRKRKKLTQHQLAWFLGISEDYLSKIERRLRLPGRYLTERIAMYYEANPNWLRNIVCEQNVWKLERRWAT